MIIHKKKLYLYPRLLLQIVKEMTSKENTAVLLFSCEDQTGLVAKISGFIHEKGGNILSLDEHVDLDDQTFFLRLSWDNSNLNTSVGEMERAFSKLAGSFKASWQMHYTDKRVRAAVFVSRYDHCLRDILWRHSMGEYNMDIPLIISNHSDLKHVAERYHIPFFMFPVTKDNKPDQEKKILRILWEYNIDSILLARYMQILSADFVKAFPNRIINIHHSFLPAFVGGNPYKQAFDRGVKIIGATSHYVTNKLDEGPIIDQDITRISHKDRVNDLIRKGRDLERLVLARAVRFHSEHRVLVHGNKTVVFE